MIYDRRGVRDHDHVIINNSVIEQVSSYKYLGIMLDNNWSWRIGLYMLTFYALD